MIPLAVGEPELPVACHILRAGAEAWERDDTAYTPNSGIAPLRRAIAAKLDRYNGYRVSDEQVHVTSGGAQALHMAMSFTLEAGSEILIPDPGYPTFSMTPRLLGAVPVPYPLSSPHGFRPDLTELESLVTPSTRALLINSPSNPLGVVFDRTTVAALLAFASRHDLWVISDEVYEYLTWMSIWRVERHQLLTLSATGYRAWAPPVGAGERQRRWVGAAGAQRGVRGSGSGPLVLAC
ncbi:pyridoxal phosphate-dependent aminotransferase [Raineyella sp. W15-4]|uniref:pyridoxal phosphate-dependent aminotransferase n=1 Tax=Raineyella sp. W15-4 TaxID=3081651 RepID=UPI002953C995|nr:aminotransferase class I/II-fold pyridoxal phosphate-dependent enzyme [Raineyella sp. W15-4]WOQ15450.1 aminotransferase class I/II-fold pyridoxal phosphate-dependent enzyme [Raineyella sp. W15-4]